ncbi:Oidioi.mRNA.OKI2018_I69.chr2.g6378.t1.cds [Oikopleura dioica]|uniref:Oidioi.mRNA.OKI2018_I69.chr2.g6378.t1.cds n=1 Tax=Oikopleura dioica TaxID=34765 RepID=A0ABN7T8Y0_OIKDI|nr:Oidioi.mRNA.OKI2018_I69.chr2.g6378.t1.cds [Oikopleura dioica]
MFYQLMVWGKYSGTVQDSLQYSSAFDHNQKNFTTFDSDNDNYEKGNCASHYKNGWWFDKCFAANLNGKFYHEPYENKMRDGIYWGRWPNKLEGKYMVFTYIDMKVRPEDFKSAAMKNA